MQLLVERTLYAGMYVGLSCNAYMEAACYIKLLSVTRVDRNIRTRSVLFSFTSRFCISPLKRLVRNMNDGVSMCMQRSKVVSFTSTGHLSFSKWLQHTTVANYNLRILFRSCIYTSVLLHDGVWTCGDDWHTQYSMGEQLIQTPWSKHILRWV